jgi:hypothetical protein
MDMELMDRPLRNSSRAPGWCVWRISPLAATRVSAPAGAQRGTPWAYGYIGEGMHSLSALRRVRWPKKVAYDPQFWFARAGLCGWARRLAPAGANLRRPPQGPLFWFLALVCASRRKPPSAAPRSAGTLGPLGRWSLRQESNLYLALRRRPFYPLNYGGMSVDFLMAASGGGSWVRQTQITSSELSSPLCARRVKRCAMR